MPPRPKPLPGRLDTLSRTEAKGMLLDRLGLRTRLAKGRGRGVQRTLAALRAIQLDPLDPLGRSPDLVIMGRVAGARRGDLEGCVYPGHGFEHFAKERCLLPADAFPYVRARAAATPWWRLSERLKRLDAGVIQSVLDEVRDRGPVAAGDLDRGSVEPLDWSGWKGTSRAATMALEVLWTRCDVVVCGRSSRGKIYDLPERALKAHATANVRIDDETYARWALCERVRASAVQSLRSGIWWSTMEQLRVSDAVTRCLEDGTLSRVRIEGARGEFLVETRAPAKRRLVDDGALRILGPLDPLLWNRGLVSELFDFDYRWEVYKPAAQRRFGWYVCPLLHRGELVGRLEGRLVQGVLRIDRVWEESRGAVDRDALTQAVELHAQGCGASDYALPRRVLRNPKG